MKDKVLKVKKMMKGIIRSNKLSRIDAYEKAILEAKTLDKRELYILISECKRDYESYDKLSEVKDIISVGLTGFGLLLTIMGIFYKDIIVSYITFNGILFYAVLFTVVSIFLITTIQLLRSRNMNVLKYMIQILESLQ